MFATAFGQLPKTWLLKGDPTSAFFNEFRISYEHRIREGSKFWYISPGYIHRDDIAKKQQKQFGFQTRAGIRQYLSKRNNAPHGMFLYLGGGYRFTKVNIYDSDLAIERNTLVHSPGASFSIGHQWLLNPYKNFVIGFHGGIEYYYDIPGKDIDRSEITEKWYQVPIANKPDFLRGFRIMAGIEAGFAFRQKNLHW